MSIKKIAFVCLCCLLIATGALGTSIETVLSASFPVIQINPQSIDFGTVQTGSASPPTIVNVGNQVGATFTLAVLVIRLEGSFAEEFAILNDHVSGSAMDGGMSSTLEVIFKPLTAGQKSAELVISANGGINLEIIDYRIPLTGDAAELPGSSRTILTSEVSLPPLTEPAQNPLTSSADVPIAPGEGDSQFPNLEGREAESFLYNGGMFCGVGLVLLVVSICILLVLVRRNRNHPTGIKTTRSPGPWT